MPTFKTFLNRLDDEHKAAKSRYADIERELKIVQKEYDATIADPKSSEVARLYAQSELLKAQAAHKEAMNSLRVMHRQYVDEIRADMKAYVDDLYLITPDKVDDKAVQLLNSGIMGVADLEHMAEQYRHNPVMLRLIGKKADDIIAANPNNYSKTEAAARQKATGLRYRIRGAEDSGKALEAFNSIANLTATAFDPDSHWAKVPDASDAHWEHVYNVACNEYDNFIVQPTSGDADN